uniref:retropepsin-like aspartic protease family protein n=1 Tax=Ningiella ruwaisensis TaxID=2364274 RepID=UPI0014482A85|nr:retropepsin-like aspartic protease [Ningiella ruwaisensis]
MSQRVDASQQMQGHQSQNHSADEDSRNNTRSEHLGNSQNDGQAKGENLIPTAKVEQMLPPTDVGLSQRKAPVSVPDTGVDMTFLLKLKKEQQYAALAFYVKNYLRENPYDLDALLLEAEAIYFTEPLSNALINYYGLLDKSLSPEQLTQIKTLIEANTQRIIQQFSSDGSWDLLATFLEPLVQVDPLNRSYIIALAKAYGMQAQTVLMENALAALPSNDPRASRLRESIYARLDNREAPLERQSDTFAPENLTDSSTGEREIKGNEVALENRRGQYYTEVGFANTRAKADMLVDTGASTTAISERIFDSINDSEKTYLGMFNVQTAGGALSSPVYRVRNLYVGEINFTNVAVMVLPSENLPDFDGLLGMNVLNQFHISYNANDGQMRMISRAEK